MPDALSPLPDNVLEAARSGNTIEAIKRLREATGLGLKDAKDLIEAHLRGESASAAPVPTDGQLPTAAVEALLRGNKIEAIKLVRAATGLGLKEAKDAVDAAEPAILGRSDESGVHDPKR